MSSDSPPQPLANPIAITFRETGLKRFAIATITGELCTGLWKAVEPHLGVDVHGVVVDLGHAPFLDSVNIAAIIATRNQVANLNKRFAVANLSPNIQAVFRILKLDRMFDLTFSLDHALENMSS